MSAPVKIGGDWVENTDASTGRKYYANTVTKVRDWTVLVWGPAEEPPGSWGLIVGSVAPVGAF